MRVLYVNQTAAVSGAERSLLALLGGLGDAVSPVVACPDGPLAEAVAALGIERVAIGGTQVSFRLHPTHTARGLAELARTVAQVARHERRLRPDVVHANTTRAALTALAPGRRAPLLAHIRDWSPPGRLSRMVDGVLGRRADQVVANSAYVAAGFEGLPTRRPVRVVHNPIDLSAFDDAVLDGGAVREELGIGAGESVISVIGQLTPWKAQDDAIRAFAGLAGEGRRAARLLVVGSAKFDGPGTQYDNRAFAAALPPLAEELGVGDRVQFLGERRDIPAVLAATDLLLLSSWREAFGRIAVEAMAAGVPVLATDDGGPAEIVTPGVDGALVPPRSPEVWTAAIAEMIDDPERLAAMGRAARSRARDFGVAPHVEAILAIYRSLLTGPAT